MCWGVLERSKWGFLGGWLGSLCVEGVFPGQSPSPSSRCPSYPREMRRVKPATPKNRTRRRRRRFSTHSSPCSLSTRSAAAGLGTAHPPGELGGGHCVQHAGPTQTAPTVPGHAPSGPPAQLEQATPIFFQAPPRPCSLLWVSGPFPPLGSPRPILSLGARCRLTAEEEDSARSLAPRVPLAAENPQPHHRAHDAGARRQHHARPCHRQHGWGEPATSAPR